MSRQKQEREDAKMGISLGIIGYGTRGELHHRYAEETEGVRVIGAYDTDPARLQAARENGLKPFPSLGALLECQEINAVVVAVPNRQHSKVCVAAANAGKHVVCEAPAALSAWELDQIIAAVGRGSRVLAVYQNHRWDRDFCVVKRLLNSNRLGKVYSLQVRLHSCGSMLPGWPGKGAAAEDGILFGWGLHVIDQLMWLLGYDDFKSVFCKTCRIEPSGTEDYCFLAFDLESGGGVQIELGGSIPPGFPRWTVLGDRAAAYLGGTAGEGRFIPLGDPLAPDGGEEDGKLPLPEPEETEAAWTAYYRNVRDVIEGSEKLAVQPWQARRVLKTVEAALQSARTGKLVSLKD